MRCQAVAVLVAVGLAMPSASSAQTTLFLMFDGMCDSGTPCPAPRILQADVERPAIVAEWPIACAGTHLAVTADGRFLLWNEVCGATPGLLRGRDLVTGGTFALGAAPPSVLTHPSQLQAWWPQGTSVIRFSTAGAATLPGGCSTAGVALSGDGTRYVHAQSCNQATPTFIVRSSATGDAVGSVSVPSTVSNVTLDERGDVLYALTGTVGGTQDVRAFTVATGSQTASRASFGDPIQGLGRVAVERRTGRLYAATNFLVEVFDGVTLAPIRSFLAGTTFSPPPVFHPLRSAAFTINPVHEAALWIADPATSINVAPVSLGRDHVRAVAVAPHLPPPVSLTSLVAGPRVTLSWTDGPRSALALGYELEVAATPGGPAFLTVPVATTGFIADGVPSGLYRVRVRALNHAGRSAPSAEVAVAVP